MYKTFKILISGQVQGVGFRPYVYTLATEFKLTGTVSNNKEGVIIFISGLEVAIQKFYERLINCPPPVSRIKSNQIQEIQTIKFKDFNIIPSVKDGQVNLPLTPDFAICDDCKNDIENKKNRRKNYPFTTCVNCGPRWSITRTFPFERAHTSIDDYPMCNDCIEEYTNPENRRFHSQTNTCNTCGISLELINDNGKIVESDSIFKTVAQILTKGKIVAIKNTSGYLLCCNAENAEVVNKLRRLKNRPNKPFAVLYPSIEQLQKDAQLKLEEIKILQSSERPITIISLSNYKGNIALNEVVPKLNQLGIMLPYTGILQLLANKLSFPIVATSGNIHGSPILNKREDAQTKLAHIADYFLHHNLEITHPQDDSVLKISKKYSVNCLFRRSRGYAPNYLDIDINSEKKILALGADLKNSIAFYPNEHLYVSQYIGNLENYDVYNRFLKETNGFMAIFEQQSEVILVDKHPNYQSTQYGKELYKNLNAELFQIQHHKAHFASVLGEYNLFEDTNILGVVWDGTGYGDDGNIWGGEFFTYQPNDIKRVSHFDYFNWVSGDKMSKEPRLSLFSIADDNFDEDIKSKFTKEEHNILNVVKNKNTLKTSSVGRLFDAVASLLNICDFNTYEGEAAIIIENQVKSYQLEQCIDYCKSNCKGEIPTLEILKGVKNDKNKGIKIEQIITNFLYTLAKIVFKVAKAQNSSKLCFSGGVFQNTTLLDMIIELNENRYKLYFNRNLAPNDENIAFGQIMYYLHCKNL